MSPLITPGKYDFTYNEALGFYAINYKFILFIIIVIFLAIILLVKFLSTKKERQLHELKINNEMRDEIERREAKLRQDKINQEQWGRLQEAKIEEEKKLAPIRQRNNEICDAINDFMKFVVKLKAFNSMIDKELRNKFILKHAYIFEAIKKNEEGFYKLCDANLIIEYELVSKELEQLNK